MIIRDAGSSQELTARRPPLLEVSFTRTHARTKISRLSMMNLAPLLRIPFYDVSGIWERWSTHAERMVVFEHEADEEVKTTHCHFLMLNVNVSVDTLKRELRERIHRILRNQMDAKYGHGRIRSSRP